MGRSRRRRPCCCSRARPTRSIPWSLSQRLYDDAAAPKWLVAIDGADHLTPYTTGPQRGAVVALVAEFLRARLQDPSRVGRAQDAANRDGLSLVASALILRILLR